ncbi:MAG: hypothetical protein GY832_22495 [Chloroflexi bacterium]|nr:hypothetical protein [Chloroflexota bacterium]
MSTNVTYNGVRMSNVVTRQWDQEIVYDDSNTDLLYHKFKLRFEGVLHVQGNPLNRSRTWTAPESGSTSAANAATLMDEVRTALGKPRKKLAVTIGGQSALICEPGTPLNVNHIHRDVDNGPKPKSVDIQHIAGDKLFRVSFSIDCCKVECGSLTGPSAVLSNRWSISESMDDKFFTTRVIAGRLRLGSAVSPFTYKNIVVPGLEKGFRRDRVSFVVAANGLEADYEITDAQTHTSAPWPAVRMTGTHNEMTGSGVDFFSEVAVKLEGGPDSDKGLMFEQALQVVDSRLNMLKRRLNNDYHLEQAAMIDHFGDRNTVEVRFRIKQFPGTNDDGTKRTVQDLLTNIGKTYLGTPIEIKPLLIAVPSSHISGRSPLRHEYDRALNPEPEIHGWNVQGGPRNPAAVLLLLQCYQQSPCSNAHAIYGGSSIPGTPQTPGTETPTEYEASMVPVLPTENPTSEVDTTSMAEGLYTYTRAETTYHTRRMKSQMPLARPTDAPPENDTSVVLALARAVCQREIIVDAERTGEWPAIPEPVESYTDGDASNPITATLLEYSDKPFPPALSADVRKKVFRIKARYLYALSRPPTAAEKTQVGILPHTSHTADETSITRNKVYQARLTPGGAS